MHSETGISRVFAIRQNIGKEAFSRGTLIKRERERESERERERETESEKEKERWRERKRNRDGKRER